MKLRIKHRRNKGGFTSLKFAGGFYTTVGTIPLGTATSTATWMPVSGTIPTMYYRSGSGGGISSVGSIPPSTSVPTGSTLSLEEIEGAFPGVMATSVYFDEYGKKGL